MPESRETFQDQILTFAQSVGVHVDACAVATPHQSSSHLVLSVQGRVVIFHLHAFLLLEYIQLDINSIGKDNKEGGNDGNGESEPTLTTDQNKLVACIQYYWGLTPAPLHTKVRFL